MPSPHVARPRTAPPLQAHPVSREPAASAGTDGGIGGLEAASALSRCARLPAMAREMCYHALAKGSG
ncbi:hypothetical protein [Streptomyces agglomeratus]|uniref:hypothetical protein n=1 Tax=Streptomyces agglomeratus TaxID=285458 RepID=UPI00114D056A|nr:hypothetical protein [Streptomyces agglomeratus]